MASAPTKSLRMYRTTSPADDATGLVLEPSRSRGADAVTLLSLLVVVRLVLPSQFVIGPLGGVGAPASLFGLGLMAYWVWHRLRRVVAETSASVNVVAFLLAVIALASYAVALTRPTGAEELNLSLLSLLLLASWMGGLLLASDGATSLERLRALLARLVVVGGLFASFGLFQFVTGTAWVDRVSIPGLVINTPVYALVDRGGFARPFSTAIHPIEFGSVLAMLLPLAIVFGLIKRRPGIVRWLAWLPAAAIALAASLSSSRSTLLDVAVGVVLLWPALTRAQRFVGTIAGAAVATFVFVAVPGMVGSITSLFGGVVSVDSSVASRIDSYAVAADYFSRAPIVGRGLGTFLPQYRIFDNQYLLSLVEMGILGMAALVLLWVVPAVGMLRRVRASEASSPQRLIGTGLFASSVVGGVGLAFFDGFGFPMMPTIWFLILGMGGAYSRLVGAPRG